MNILVAGIGNIFLGDDGFGCEVARRLAMRPQRPGVHVVDFGIRGFDLAFALLDRPDLTIFVDAVSRGGTPGTLYVIEPDLAEVETGNSLVDMHGMSPMRVLHTVKEMGGRFGKVLVVGCEPADFGDELEGRMGLTEPVAGAIDAAMEMVENLLEKMYMEAAA